MRPRVLPLWCIVALPLALVVPGIAQADWVNDEAFLKKLRAHHKELETSVAIFERHRRSLDMVEAGISSLQLGLADPEKKPHQIITQMIKESFPGVILKLKRLRSSKHKGINTWRWRLELQGRPGELMKATAHLQRLGMFILPGALEQYKMKRKKATGLWRLSLVGHHVRLQNVPLKPLPRIKGSVAFARRTDPLALEIKKILEQISVLRHRIAYIQQFEARINEIKRFLYHLRMLGRMARDPVPEVELVRKMELIHVGGIVHEGSRVIVSGEVHSPGFRKAARRWLQARSTPALRYQAKTLGLRWAPRGTLPTLPAPPKGSARGGPRCTLLAVDAAATAVASAAGGLLAVKAGAGAGVTGKISGQLHVALEAAARGLNLTIVRQGRRALLVKPGQEEQARETLRQGLHPPSQPARSSTEGPGLSDLRLRLLVLGGGRSLAVLTGEDGAAHRVKKGSKLGSNGSRVVTVDKKGVTVLWVDGRRRERLTIPLGKPRK